MDETIIRSDAAVTLLGAGPVPAGALDAALKRAPRLVAADGGAVAALEAGHLPEAVIGDFDSLPADVAGRLPQERLHHVSEQMTTDFDKVLRHVAAPLLIGVGFLGARLDHELAALNVLVRHARPCLLLGAHDVVFAAPRQLSLSLAPGTRVSLFPLTPVRGRSEGLEWPIDELELRPDAMIGTSNRATGPVRLWLSGPGALVILPPTELDAAITALRGAA